ncbi:MAG: hypothetical protein R3A78_03155 [Polyangiales bacterium]|nr:hypothetical protein [Myxococcales bacterium]
MALLSTMQVASIALAQGDDPSQSPDPNDDPASGQDPNDEPQITPRANSLVEAETTYRGALILRGGDSLDNPETDITMGAVSVGREGDPATTRVVGKFIGNTLNAEARDEDNNTVLFNAEFYWFESSVPRGSDFFVAVIKAVNSPNRADKWVLEHSANGTWDFIRPDHGPVLQMRAETDPQLNYGGFRFDWSIPKDDYGIDQVGGVTMTAAYGAGLKGEGSAQYAYSKDFGETQYCNQYMGGEQSYGCAVGTGTQVNGALDLTYSVNTKYEIKLYTWDVYSDLTPTTMLWTMFLRTSAQQMNKAYHEFFVAMQTPEGEEFHINKLELLGSYKKPAWGPWPDDRRMLSIAINDINFRRPKDALQRARTLADDPSADVDGSVDTSDFDDSFGYTDDSIDGDGAKAPAAGCGGSSVAPTRGTSRGVGLFALVLAGAFLGRRRWSKRCP